MRSRTVLIAAVAAFFVGLCMVTTLGTYFLLGTRGGEADGNSRAISSFDRIDFSGVGDLFITQGSQETLEIDASRNTLSRIRTEVRGDTLHISIRSSWFGFFPRLGDVNYYVTVRELNSLQASGAGNVYAENLSSEELEIDSSGASDITLDNLNAEYLTVDLSGAGSIEIGGTVRHQNVDISGSGRYRAQDLRSESAEVELSGASNATLWVEDDLDVSISGVGNVDYYGSPRLSQDVSGVGNLTSMGERSR